jgi:hypothetical protein
VRFPCVHAVATTPAQRLRILFARYPNRISLPRKGRRVGLCDVLFEACLAFIHITAYTLAGSPIATPYIGGFSHFVTSIAAPIAFRPERFSRVGLSPTGKAPPYHGAHPQETLERYFRMAAYHRKEDSRFSLLKNVKISSVMCE